jgi:hypothetical protein
MNLSPSSSVLHVPPISSFLVLSNYLVKRINDEGDDRPDDGGSKDL